MSLLTKNIAANFAGNLWATLMGIAFIPFYIHFLGIEAFGIIGFFTTLQIIFTVFDMGMSVSLNRELARLSVTENSALEMRATLRSLELPYWAITAIIGLSMILLSSLIATHWFQTANVSSTDIHHSVMLMGGTLALQFCTNLYSAGLLGLQRHVLQNLVFIIASTFRGAGTILVLWQVSSSLTAFFLFQLMVNACQLIIQVYFLWHNLPKALGKVHFQIRRIRRMWKFTSGVAATTILAVILTHVDKIILSYLLPLESFGYYMLAWTVALGLYRVINPVYTAFFPRFSQLITGGDMLTLSASYHAGCQLMAVLVFPISATVFFFSKEILHLWTQNPSAAANSHMILSLLITGTALNGIMHLPYALQLSYGWTSLSLISNLIAAILLVPAIYMASSLFGAVGPAYVWIALNSAYVVISLQLMHRRILPSEKWLWYREDLLQPLIASFAASIATKYIFQQLSSAWAVYGIVLCLLSSFLASNMAAPIIRTWLMQFLVRTHLGMKPT